LSKVWTSSSSASGTLNKVLASGIKTIGVEDEGFRVHDLRHTLAHLTAKVGADVGDL